MQTAPEKEPARANLTSIINLRALLAEKFPQPPARHGGVFPVELGGKESDSGEPGNPDGSGKPNAGLELRRGAVTEVAGSPGSGALFLESLLESARAAQAMMALVDGSGGFEPASAGFGPGQPGPLLWVRCGNVPAALKAADLLLRDGNLPLVALDLQMNPAAELRRIPPHTWYRFQRILEPSEAAFVVLTPGPMVGGAAERLLLRNRWSLRAMHRRRAELRRELAAEPVRRRRFGPLTVVERRIA